MPEVPKIYPNSFRVGNASAARALRKSMDVLDFLCVIESGEMVNVSLFAREAANFNALEHSLCFAQIGKESLFFTKKF